MISVNTIIGTFDDITTEQVIPIPNAEKIVFVVDSAGMMISINDNQHYQLYKNSDGVIEFINDPANSLYITKIYVKSQNESWTTSLRVWAKV